MLQISAADFIGKGLHRECYRHPDNLDRCIKVVHSGDHEESRRERAYYRFLQKRNISWRLLPRFHGEVQTNLGPGVVFDLIRNADGSTARPLEYYLEEEQRTDAIQSSLEVALGDLRDYLLAERIVTMTIKPKNILFKRLNDASGQLFIVDNIGNSDFIPVCNYVPAMALRKIRRKWERFEASLRKDFAENRVLQTILNKPV